MKKVKITVNELVHFLGSEVLTVLGDMQGMYVDNLADVVHVCETTLDWVNLGRPDRQQVVESSKAHVILVDEGVLPVAGKVLVVVKNPKRALAKVGNAFFVEHPVSGIHPTALIDSGAQIGKGVYVGPYTVIGKASIGDECVIDSHVRIYDDVILGKGCEIKTGAVIGGAGFGFERDEQGNRFPFPQVGGVIIGDNVEVGSNTCIDRGSLSDTIIGDHTKINNLCHIAHNNHIGRNVVIAGCVNVSGSNVIDDDVWIAPNSSIRGFVHLGEGCMVGMGAVVVKNIPPHEVWVGNPARKIEEKSSNS